MTALSGTAAAPDSAVTVTVLGLTVLGPGPGPAARTVTVLRYACAAVRPRPGSLSHGHWHSSSSQPGAALRLGAGAGPGAADSARVTDSLAFRRVCQAALPVASGKSPRDRDRARRAEARAPACGRQRRHCGNREAPGRATGPQYTTSSASPWHSQAGAGARAVPPAP